MELPTDVLIIGLARIGGSGANKTPPSRDKGPGVCYEIRDET